MNYVVRVLLNGSERCDTALVTAIPWYYWTIRTYWRELGCALVGALLRTITPPLRSEAGRFLTAASLFVDKWMETCFHRYRRYRCYVSRFSVQNKPRCDRYWIMFETFWVTPLVVLETRCKHEDGVGRLLHNWKSAKKYWNGIRMEGWTSSRAWCACKWAWTLTYVLVFGHLYLTVCSYDLVEWLRMGWPSVTVLLMVINYCFASSDGLLNSDLSSADPTVLLGSLTISSTKVESNTLLITWSEKDMPLIAKILKNKSKLNS
ncbi:hypothetical protein PHMEG_000697 [Phytophthora megakarya]|uniref:Uncharacterized protein n=1 Tax=Phytophthora megakarya TaxID=4795 RepID=A0A225X4W1_9STRA|nr:hypothetical protein PHMEG_000697 [Phytophthora megakarya]